MPAALTTGRGWANLAAKAWLNSLASRGREEVEPVARPGLYEGVRAESVRPS